MKYPIYHADGSVTVWKGRTVESTTVILSQATQAYAVRWLLGQLALWLDLGRLR